MSLPPNWQWFASLLLDRMLIWLAARSVLAGGVWLLLHLVPRKNSHTRFAVRLSTLIAIAVLPLLRAGWEPWRPHDPRYATEHALVTIPSTWATYLVLLWAAIAIAGLLRVAAGLWTLRRLRRGCTEIPSQLLGRELREAITEFPKLRPISILLSPRVEVPGAIGFFRPAIVLPSWLAEDLASTELKYVVLHELAHLRRWDDWTNLAQKFVKAFLFFHPGVWLIERKLLLDREMACDDAVLARAGGARQYAQSLAHVAEKSFLRRQFALAQAVVDGARQLTLRVAQILNEDEGHPRAKGLWKPALPIVTALALVLAYAASRAPDLVLVSDTLPTVETWHATSLHPGSALTQTASSPVATRQAQATPVRGDALAGNASRDVGASLVPALYIPPKRGERSVAPQFRKRVSHPRRDQNVAPKLSAFSRAIEGTAAPLLSEETGASLLSEETPTVTAQPDAIDQGAVLVVFVSERVVARGVIARNQAGLDGAEVVQVKMWEIHWVVPASRPAKLTPRKT